jgi:SAM-dependent methyltransferase
MSYGIKALARRAIRHFGYELIPVQACMPKAIRADYDPILEIMGSYRFKFLDVKTFLPTTLNRAYYLGLHKSKPLDILDIGTGVGYFPVVCKYYGHQVVAIDRDGNPVFEDVTRWLEVDRRSSEIKAFSPVPYQGRKFDLITAFMVNFDRYDPPEYKPWGTKEWDYFLEDMGCNHLKEGGRLALLLNDHTLQLPAVMKKFAERRAHVDGAWVTI